MANTRIGIYNFLTVEAALLKNGTGGGAPALIETAPYVMSNLLNGDRSSLWKTSVLSSASTYNVDFDMGASVEFDAMGMLGYRLATGTGPQIDMYYQTGAYTPAGAWTLFSQIFPEGRDLGVVTTIPVTARSARFKITPVAASESFSLGSFFVGDIEDLGGIHSPGGLRNPFQNRLETPMLNGSFVITRLGDDGQTWTMPWNSIKPATRSILNIVQGRRGTVLLVDAEDNWSEVFLRGGGLSEGRTGGPDVFDINIELVRMP